MYTKNIYRLDEVKAALQYAIHTREHQEAIFWANELIISEEFDDLKIVLFVSWFYSIGLGNIEILYNIVTATEHDLLNIVYGMATLKESMRDCTLPVMFLYGIANKEYKNRNIYFELPAALVQTDPVIEAFIRAVLLGKFLEAWFLYQKGIPESILKTIIDVKFKTPFVKQLMNTVYELFPKWYMCCALIGILCCTEEMLTTAQGSIRIMDNEEKESIRKINEIKEKRKARILSVPRDSLYGKTKRGTMTFQQSNIHELYDPDYIVENSTVFQSIEEIYGCMDDFKVQDTTARNYEDFMEWYFPDDIPDEWSLADQQKSHGIGVNQSIDKPNVRRYFGRWVSLKSKCKIWDKETIVNCLLEKITVSSFYIEMELLAAYEKMKVEKENEKEVEKEKKDPWNLKAMKLVLSTLE